MVFWFRQQNPPANCFRSITRLHPRCYMTSCFQQIIILVAFSLTLQSVLDDGHCLADSQFHIFSPFISQSFGKCAVFWNVLIFLAWLVFLENICLGCDWNVLWISWCSNLVWMFIDTLEVIQNSYGTCLHRWTNK